MDRRRQANSSDHGIEMTTFSETSIRRSRSGSFTGTIVDSPGGRRSGYSEFTYSKRTGVFDVKTIASDVGGGGKRMLSQMESIAREHGANAMETATSRPGFFKKGGFDYTPEQHQINQRKYAGLELQRQEENRGEGGGGFMMRKIL